jgi:hypothetical protein
LVPYIVALNGTGPCSRLLPASTSTCAPENPLSPIGAKRSAGTGSPSIVIVPTPSVGTTRLMAWSSNPVAGVVTV